MKKKLSIVEIIFMSIFILIILVSLFLAASAVFNAEFALKLEYYIQKTYAYYDFNLVNVATLVAIVTCVVAVFVLVILDNKHKIVKRKVVRR